jgi:hypothetical protein
MGVPTIHGLGRTGEDTHTSVAPCDDLHEADIEERAA